MLCVALALSYLESILPAWTVIPLPGVKPGLANIVVVLLVRRGYVADGAAVSFCANPLPFGAAFGGPVSFLISLSGGAAAFAAFCLCTFAFSKFVGPLGTSVPRRRSPQHRSACCGIAFDVAFGSRGLPAGFTFSRIIHRNDNRNHSYFTRTR